MPILKLQLINFRNYGKKAFKFDAGMTLIVGDNAIGKSNIVEAVWLLSTGKSFRATRDEQMIKEGEELARVVSGEVEVVLTRGVVGGQQVPKKRYLVNGVPKRRMDVVGKLPVVLFRPEDVDLVTGSPAGRREYLDSVLEQVDSEYRRSLLSYSKGLRQRNKLLERIGDGEAQRSQLTFWDQLLIKNGDVIAQKRQEFIEFVNQAFERERISQVFGGLKLEYDRSVISEARLEHYAASEVAAGVTLVGPHRDDFKTQAGVRDLAIFGSRGEQRLAVLAVKLAELSFVTSKVGERPLLLLDDIFSELDHEHRQDVLEVVGQQQTIMTTTDLHLVDKKYQKKMQVIQLQ